LTDCLKRGGPCGGTGGGKRVCGTGHRRPVTVGEKKGCVGGVIGMSGITSNWDFVRGKNKSGGERFKSNNQKPARGTDDPREKKTAKTTNCPAGKC